MEEENSSLTVFRRNRERDPRLVEQAIRLQTKLIDILRNNVKETPHFLKRVRDLLMSGVNALAPDHNLRLHCISSERETVSLPLHIAVVNGLPNVTEMLLEYTGHPNVANKAGVTAAHLAAASGATECLKTLIESEADVNATTWLCCFRSWKLPRACLHIEQGSTPLHLAAQGGHLECVTLLLDHGANVNAMDVRQQSPLYLAACAGHPECLMVLLHSTGDCPDVLTPTDTQDTALIQCFAHGKKMRDCIRELVYRGADVCHCNMDGHSAVHEAVNNNWDMDMMKLLIVEGRGMDFDRTESGSPLHLIMSTQVWHYCYPIDQMTPLYTDGFESKAIFFLRMGATGRELKRLLWHELNLPKAPGVLLETLMNTFGCLPSLCELEADLESRPPYVNPFSRHFQVPEENRWVCSGALWHRLEAGMTEEARRQEEERLRAIVVEKRRQYEQRRTEVPSLAHLSRASIRNHLQADVRKVISWSVPEQYKRYILLDYDLRA